MKTYFDPAKGQESLNAGIACVMCTFVGDGSQPTIEPKHHLEDIRYTLKCYERFKDSSLSYDLILVDNDSEIKSWFAEYPQYKILHRENAGFSFAAYLYAWRTFGKHYRYYLFHEQNVAPARPDWLQILINEWSKHPYLGLIGNTMEVQTDLNLYSVKAREEYRNLDGSWFFTSSEVLEKVENKLSDLLGYRYSYTDSILNEVKFIQPFLEVGYQIGYYGLSWHPDNESTWFCDIGDDSSKNIISGRVAETITPLFRTQVRRYPEMKEYLSKYNL